MRGQEILDQLGWDSLPENWHWHRGDILEALQGSYCIVGMSTGGVADAVLYGRIVVSLKQELNTPWNYLDNFEKEFPIVSSVSKHELMGRLEEIYISRPEHYLKEFERLRMRLLKGYVPPNDDTLRVFIPHTNAIH